MKYREHENKAQSKSTLLMSLRHKRHTRHISKAWLKGTRGRRGRATLGPTSSAHYLKNTIPIMKT